MKKEQVRVGEVYTAKVSGSVVPVRIVQEKWTGDRHTGWVGTNVETGRSVRIKSAQRLRAAVTEPQAAVAPSGVVQPLPRASRLANVAGDVGASGAPSDPVGTSAVAASPVPPTATSGGKRAKGKKAPSGQKAKSAKARKPKADKPMSGLDAAAKILADSGEPMRVKDIVAAAEKKGLWKSKAGKTPEATVYAAIVREIFNKGVNSRFVKKERGLFAAAGKGA